MSSLRVAVDVGPLHGRRTGVGNAVAWTIEALEDRADVDLLPYLVSMRATITPPERRVPIPAALAHRWWSHRSPPLDRWIGRPDVVHGTNYVVPPARCPRVASVYDCWFLDHPDEASPAVLRAGEVLRRSVADGAEVLACSQATADRAADVLGTDRVTTVLLGPPPSIVNAPRSDHPVVDGDAPFILMLGTMERRKNVAHLIAAFERLAREHRDVRLVIAGADGDDTPTLHRSITALPDGVRRRVTRLGVVDAPTKQRLLEDARALAYPSLDEGFGFPILEAQQAGTPVVATAVGSIPEVAGSAALLSPPGDVDALAANLHWVVTSDDMRAKLARRGRSNLDRFSWDRTAAELSALYHRLAEGNQR